MGPFWGTSTASKVGLHTIPVLFHFCIPFVFVHVLLHFVSCRLCLHDIPSEYEKLNQKIQNSESESKWSESEFHSFHPPPEPPCSENRGNLTNKSNGEKNGEGNEQPTWLSLRDYDWFYILYLMFFILYLMFCILYLMFYILYLMFYILYLMFHIL